MDNEQMRTWAQVDLSALEENYHTLRGLLAEDCKFLGVVKANGYGHGAVAVAKKLEDLGCDYLAVACLSEAMELRREKLSLPILILGVTPERFVEDVLRHDLVQTVESVEQARVLSDAAEKLGLRARVHLKVDTGMSRLGFFWERAVEETEAVFAMPHVEVEGIYTHFAAADEDETYTMLQLERFLSVTDTLAQRGHTIPLRHCASSAAVLNFPCTHLDMVRPGIALYGHVPAAGMEHICPLRPVMTLKTRVAAVRTLPAGTAVSYGCTATLSKDTTLAVLPVGYADGLPRALSNQGEVLIHGKRCPIVGRVCMDMCMVALDNAPETQAGDEVTVYTDVAAAAAQAGTICYELLTGLSERVPRVYR